MLFKPVLLVKCNCISSFPQLSAQIKKEQNRLLLFKYTLLVMLLQWSHFFPLYPSALHLPSHQHPPSLSSCPWVIHISTLASPFPKLFLTPSCLFCTYQLYFLFPVPFPPFSPLHLPTDNPLCDPHFCDSVPVLVVCLVFIFYVQFRLLIIVSLFSFYCSYFFIFLFLGKSL